MKMFEQPVIQIERLEIADVITASCGADAPDCTYDLGE